LTGALSDDRDLDDDGSGLRVTALCDERNARTIDPTVDGKG
jgi:hypothetical protein